MHWVRIKNNKLRRTGDYSHLSLEFYFCKRIIYVEKTVNHYIKTKKTKKKLESNKKTLCVMLLVIVVNVE